MMRTSALVRELWWEGDLRHGGGGVSHPRTAECHGDLKGFLP
jgi:hypothetical protein